MKLWVKIALAAALVLALGAVAVFGGIYWYWFSGEKSPWSSESAEARAELDAGFRDFEKGYDADAALHFERARELDPKSAAALVFSAFTQQESSKDREVLEQLKALDASRFTDNELFLARLFEAEVKRDRAAVSSAVEDFLSRHPKEALALSMRCKLLWDAKKWDEAEACYRDILEVQPQWVQAQDRLGLLAMSRGRFAEAEDHFITYRYVAPNLPAPYSSIAILFLFTGRYEESEKAFRRALEIKRDFCPALSGLTHLYTVWGKLPEALEAIAQTEAQPACRALAQAGNTCSRRIFITYLQQDLPRARELDQDCPMAYGYSLGKHQLASWTGEFARAEEMEAAIHKTAGIDPAQQPAPFQMGFWHYFRGVRLIFQENYSEAAKEFELADGELRFWSGDNAILAFVNNVHWVYSLELAGRQQEAQALRRKIGAVNPRMLESFRIPVIEAKLAARRR